MLPGSLVRESCKQLVSVRMKRLRLHLMLFLVYCSTSQTDSGHYVFSSGWDARSPDQTARLLSPPLTISHPSSLTFWYQMNGQGVGSLTVLRHRVDRERRGRWGTSRLWMATGRQGLDWKPQHLLLEPGHWQIEFRTTVRHVYGSDIALDDISFHLGTSSLSSRGDWVGGGAMASNNFSGHKSKSTPTPSFQLCYVTSTTVSLTGTSSAAANASRQSLAVTPVSKATSSSSYPSLRTNRLTSPSSTSPSPIVTRIGTSAPTSTSGGVSELFSSSRSPVLVSGSPTSPSVNAHTDRQTHRRTVTSIASSTHKATLMTKKPDKVPTTPPQLSVISGTMTPVTTKKPFWSLTSSPKEKPHSSTTKKEDAKTPTPLTVTTTTTTITTTTTKKKQDVGSEASSSHDLSPTERRILISVSVGLIVVVVLMGLVYECLKRQRPQDKQGQQGVTLPAISLQHEQQQQQQQQQQQVKQVTSLNMTHDGQQGTEPASEQIRF